MSTETLRLDVGRTDDDGNAKVYFLLGDVAEADAWLPLDVVVALQSALARLAEVEAERDAATKRAENAERVIRNAHQAIRTSTTAAAVALAMFDTRDCGKPSLLDELRDANATVEAWRPVVEAAIAYENRWRRYAGIQPGADSVDVRLAKAKAHQALLDATRTLDSTTPGATDGD